MQSCLHLLLLKYRSFPFPCLLYTPLLFLSNSFCFTFYLLLFLLSSRPLLDISSSSFLPISLLFLLSSPLPPQVCLLPLSWPPAVPCGVGCSGALWAVIALLCLTLTQVHFSLPTSVLAPPFPPHFPCSMFSHFPPLCRTPLNSPVPWASAQQEADLHHSSSVPFHFLPGTD